MAESGREVVDHGVGFDAEKVVEDDRDEGLVLLRERLLVVDDVLDSFVAVLVEHRVRKLFFQKPRRGVVVDGVRDDVHNVELVPVHVWI